MKLSSRRLIAIVFVLALVAATSPARADFGDCAQPLTSGDKQTASDCLFILRAAVGTRVCDPQCVCDTNADTVVTASDSLLCLRNAVGQNAPLDCQCFTCGFFVNSNFDYQVTAELQNGWTFENLSGGGWRQSGGNPGGYFTLNHVGQAVDPVVRQTVSGLVVGNFYEVSGDYRSFAPSFGDPLKADAFQVVVEPQPANHDSIVVLGLPRPAPDPLAWTFFSVTFQASASTVTVSFFAERGDDSSFDVDNLCLAAAAGPVWSASPVAFVDGTSSSFGLTVSTTSDPY